ncbi:MAG: LacI family transcriptional regulator [Rhodobacter sp.]|nr:LacI family transcriptional regulator [Rhodobacter sp.]
MRFHRLARPAMGWNRNTAALSGSYDIPNGASFSGDGATVKPKTESVTDGLKPGERPTLKTIAGMTGLAVATVSRALNDAPDIGKATKVLVRETAERVGYRPNRAGVRLRTGKTNVISLVLSTDHDMMTHTSRLISSIAATLNNTPYHMIVTPYFASDDPMKPVRYIVETGSADGVILNQTTPRDPRVEFLMKHRFPFATHGRTDWSDQHPYFDFDNDAFAGLAVAELVRLGRRNLMLVLPPESQNYSIEMRGGAERAAVALNARVSVLAGANSDRPSAAIETAVGAHMMASPATDGILCASPTACMAATAAVEKLGRIVGRDIDIAAKEAIPFLKRFRPPILAVQEDVARAGQFVAEATIKRIADPDADPMQYLDIPLSIE